MNWEEVTEHPSLRNLPHKIELNAMSNSVYEVLGKRKLYFEQSAKEVWICDEYGEMTFYNQKRKLKKSIMFPAFPAKIKIQR
jgi:hypothetical protein